VDLAASIAAEQERSVQRYRSQRQLQTRGVLYLEQARNMVKQREEEGGSQLQRAQRREQNLQKQLEDERRRNANLMWTIENGPVADLEA
jgi:hypothetical protein